MNLPRLDKARGNTVRRWLRMLGLSVALAGCGGGVDSGGTGASTASYASGPITGFGSVIVNGVRFDDSGASVTDADGAPRSRDDLRLGMTTTIRGSAITTDSTGSSVSAAASIAFSSEIIGPVDALDAAANRIVVLGQSVEIQSTTVFDDASLAGGFAALNTGDVLEVYGFFDAATGRYVATRVERKGSSVTAYRLRGVVSQLDASAKAFNIGTQRISFAGVAGAVPPNLANGAIVRVRLQTSQVGGAWLVATIEEGVEKPDDRDEVRLEGLVTAFTSASLFSVNGVVVDASRLSPVAGLALGVRVEVEGSSRAGQLLATELKVKTPADEASQQFELRGAIASVAPANLSFVLRGVTVSYSLVAPATDFRDGTAANLVPGANLEARGSLSADGTRLLAARITFK